MRMLGAAIIVLAGAVCSLGSGDSADLALFVMFVGGVMFVIDYIRSWKRPEDK